MKKTIKRIFAGLMATVVCLLALPASALPAASVTADAVVGKPGEEAAVTLSLANDPGIAYLKLKIGYDAEALTLIGVENAGLLGGTFTTSETMDTNPFVLQWMSASNSTGNGLLATLTFRIASDAAGDLPVSVSMEEAYNESLGDVSVTATGGCISVW